MNVIELMEAVAPGKKLWRPARSCSDLLEAAMSFSIVDFKQNSVKLRPQTESSFFSKPESVTSPNFVLHVQ